MNVTRSIVYGVVGPCKTESSQKPVPVHPTVLEALAKWKEGSRYTKSDDWVSRQSASRYRSVADETLFLPLGPLIVRCENPPFEAGYGFVSFICFASSASSILAGRSLGRVQFLKRCGMTA
jgi:hypothetical protein